MTRRSNAATEELLLKSMQDLVSHVEDENMAPTRALCKVASDRNLAVPHIKVLATMYNNGRTSQARQAPTIAEKAASFPLADAAKAIAELYPANVATKAAVAIDRAMSIEYEHDPDFLLRARQEKEAWDAANSVEPVQASRPPLTPETQWRKLASLERQITVCEERLYEDALAAEDTMNRNVSNLANYFRSHGKVAMDECRWIAYRAMGPAAEVIFREVEKKAKLKPELASTPKEEFPDAPPKPKSRAKKKPPQQLGDSDENPATLFGFPKKANSTRPFNVNAEPFNFVKAAVDAGKTALAKTAELQKFAAEARAKLLEVLWQLRPVSPLPPDPRTSVIKLAAGIKRANDFGSVGDAFGYATELGMGHEFGKSILDRALPDSKDKLENKAFMAMYDPAHETTLRAIRSKANLAAVMRSSFFEGEDPKKVVDLYNNVVRLTPRLSEHPIALEAAMRQYASQGAAGLHDIGQIIDIESKLKQQQQTLMTGDTPAIPTPSGKYGAGSRSD